MQVLLQQAKTVWLKGLVGSEIFVAILSLLPTAVPGAGGTARTTMIGGGSTAVLTGVAMTCAAGGGAGSRGVITGTATASGRRAGEGVGAVATATTKLHARRRN